VTVLPVLASATVAGGTSLERQIGCSVKLTSYLFLVPKLKVVLYLYSWCVFFYIQGSLTLFYRTTYKIIST